MAITPAAAAIAAVTTWLRTQSLCLGSCHAMAHMFCRFLLSSPYLEQNPRPSSQLELNAKPSSQSEQLSYIPISITKGEPIAALIMLQLVAGLRHHLPFLSDHLGLGV